MRYLLCYLADSSLLVFLFLFLSAFSLENGMGKKQPATFIISVVNFGKRIVVENERCLEF